METTRVTFKQYAEQVAISQCRPGQTVGQHTFNLLTGVRPDIANQIRGRHFVDPYYDDSLLPAFWAAVENLWDR